MNSQDIRALQEAYLDVYQVDEATAMAKRGYDETEIRNKIANSTWGGEAADRATALANQPTYGQRGVDPNARDKYARAQRGDFRATNSSSPGLRGYPYNSNDPTVNAKQEARAAQRRTALTPNERLKLGSSAQNVGSPSGTGGYKVGASTGYGLQNIRLADEYNLYDIILSHLLDEGYAETLESAERIMVNMSEGWRQSIIEDAPPRDEPLWPGPDDKSKVKPPVKKPETQTTQTKQPPLRNEPLW